MKNLMKEFREFLDSGDFITIAVGLVMALYVKDVVDSIVNGVINPIISAIVGKPDITDLGFTIHQARFSIGLIISALIRFVVVGFILFLLIRAYNKFRDRNKVEDTQAPAPETELAVLRDIRDQLRNR
jgi:large conductance mechanosensitive channel